MACTGWWSNGRLSFELPRTPLHALGRLLLSYFSRPLTYDPLAKVYTKTPVTIRALYRQRLRWNSSRVQDVGRWLHSHAYNWHIGLPVLAGLFVIVGVTASVLASFLLWPITTQPAGWFPILVVSLLGYHVTRVLGSLTAMAIGASFREDAVKLLSLPASGPFHFVFNIVTTIQGLCTDVFGFGLRTNFSPERTLKRSGLERLALGFRLRRALSLAVCSVVHGGVPFGRFWFGWHETPWTPSGFEGWDTDVLPPAVRKPVVARASDASSRA
jgi:hypothetical protein